MISRRPETWTSGGATDNEKAEQPMSSPQQQGKAEAQRPGSNGWGTCAELLLVSAVKKHGALNWNLIALELKARAILLNLSPACFSEEACRFNYNVLKGKFASSSSSGIPMGEDVNVDGGVLFEELRKLRMSHLKEELQQYDSSIGQLQSRIRKMKEERAQHKPHSGIKQSETLSADLCLKGPKASDSKATMARRVDEPLDKAPGPSGKGHMQYDFQVDNLGSPAFDVANRRRPSSSMSQDRLYIAKDAHFGSSSKAVVKDLSDDLQLAGESSLGRKSSSVPSNQQLRGLEKEEPVRVEDSAINDGEHRAPSLKEPEHGREVERKTRPSSNCRPHQMIRSGSAKGEKDKEKSRKDVFGKNRTEVSEKLEQGDVAQSSGPKVPAVEVADTEGFGASPRVLEPVPLQVPDGRDKPQNGNSKPLAAASEAEGLLRHDSLHKVDGDAREGRGGKGEVGLRRDSDLPKFATVSYGRSVSKNRSRGREGTRSQGPESRILPASVSKLQRLGEAGGQPDDESKGKSKSHASPEQRSDKGKASGNDLFPCEKVDNWSSKGGSESALTTNCQETGDKVVELRDLSDVRKSFSNSRDGKRPTATNKAIGSREVSDEKKLTSMNKVIGSKDGSEEKKPMSNKIVGTRETTEEKKSISNNRGVGSRAGSDEKRSTSSGKVVEARELGDWKKTMSINKLVGNRDVSDDKKLSGVSKAVEAREQSDGKKLANCKLMESREAGDARKPLSNKVFEAREISEVKKPPSTNLASGVVADVLAVPGPSNRAGEPQSVHSSPAPSSSSDMPPRIVQSPGLQETVTGIRSRSPQVLQETVPSKRPRSPNLILGVGGEQRTAVVTDTSQKLKRNESVRAVTISEGDRKGKAMSKPSTGVKSEGWLGKRQLEQKTKTMDMDTDGVKERKLDQKPKRSRSLTNDVSDTLWRKESGDAQEGSTDCLEGSEERQQMIADYDTSQVEKSEVASSMDSIEDMSPSSRKNRREAKVPGKLLPLLECLRVICAHKSAALFKQRQDYQEKCHYSLVVRRHVDLGMVRSRLEEGAYSGSVEFFRDLLLVFTNALVYSSKESQEYSGAKSLRSCALVEMEKILQTEALLKQNGPATRKRDVRKSVEVHKNRLSAGSGVEARKKITGKNNSTELAADFEGGQERTTGPVEDSPKAGGSSDGYEDEREVDGRSETFKKPTPNRVIRDETLRKESNKPEMSIIERNRNNIHITGRKLKADNNAAAAQPSKSHEAGEARPKGGPLDENLSAKLPAKLKDVMCLDTDNNNIKAAGHSAPIAAHSRPPQPAKLGSASRQQGPHSTSRGYRYSKRSGDSSGSNPKKRLRK